MYQQGAPVLGVLQTEFLLMSPLCTHIPQVRIFITRHKKVSSLGLSLIQCFLQLHVQETSQQVRARCRWIVFREPSLNLKAEGISKLVLWALSAQCRMVHSARPVPSFSYFSLCKRLQTSGWMALKKAESTAVVEKWFLDHTTDKPISLGELCEAWSWAGEDLGAGEMGPHRARRGL